MTERELDKLKDLPTPAPGDAARKFAVASALAAFDDAANNSAHTQGDATADRPTDATSNKQERQGMRYNRKVYWSIAASVAAVLLAINTMQTWRQPEQQWVTVKTPLAPGGRGDATKSPVIAMAPPAPAAVPAQPAAKPAEDGLGRSVDERAAELAATAARKGNRKVEMIVEGQEGQRLVVKPSVSLQPAPPPPPAERKTFRPGSDEERAAFFEALRKAQAGKSMAGQTIATPDVPQRTVSALPPQVAAPSKSVTTGGELQAKGSDGYAVSNNNARTRLTGEATLNQLVTQDKAKPDCPPGHQCLVFNPRNALNQPAAQDKSKLECLPAVGCVLAPATNRDKFDVTPPNPIKSTATEPVSTFSVDVDTASYALARRFLNQGRLPPKDAIRVEEMINYFKYDYRRPESAAAPFEPQVTITPSPWNANNKLVHIALKGYEIKAAERPRANIVLLVDISGSMMPADRLPLLKNAFRMMVDELKPDDTIGIVTYASGSDIRLPPTKVADKARILAAIDSLGAGGSTAGAAGLTDAYRVAEQNFDAKAVNRIILGTDGDWNVGITNQSELTAYIERKRQSGIFLSILGVGMGNHNDALMQKLAQNGNGVAAYIDTLSEARKVLVDEISSQLFTIAKDVKIQVEFNPARVSEYRLIGYETRALRREDFNNDKVDAGDVGSGHAVTAIYEITPVGAPAVAMPELRYGPSPAAAPAAPARIETTAKDAELGFLKLRYKLPAEETSRLIELPITAALGNGDVAAASDDVRFSIAVAAYGQLLRGSQHMGALTYDDVIALAKGARGADPFGLRGEFVNLARLAKSARP